MSRTGYECAKCGYEPTQAELQAGRCPRCKPLWPEVAGLVEEAKAEESALPTGSIRICVLIDVIAKTPAEAYGHVMAAMTTLVDNNPTTIDGWESSEETDWYGADGEPLTPEEIQEARNEYFNSIRCRYSDCPDGNPVAEEHEQVTCPTCRDTLGLTQRIQHEVDASINARINHLGIEAARALGMAVRDEVPALPDKSEEG